MINFKIDPIGYYKPGDVGQKMIHVHRDVSEKKRKEMTAVYALPVQMHWISVLKLHQIERQIFGNDDDERRRQFAVEIIRAFCERNGIPLEK